MEPIPLLRLNDGSSLPRLGFGVYEIPPNSTRAAVATAIEAGYRLVDTASIYGNESGVGDAVRSAQVPRSELFVTTKVWNDGHGYEPALRACAESLRRLGLDYIDLYLIHWPALREFHEGHGIVTECWSPLAQGDIPGGPVARLAEKYGKTRAQVTLRWHIDCGLLPIPKSATPSRIRENRDLFDFKLAPEELAEIAGLDRGFRLGPGSGCLPVSNGDKSPVLSSVPLKLPMKQRPALLLVRISLLAALAPVPGSAEAALREYPVAPLPATREIAPGPAQPNWESLERTYHCPDWYRDAKFGIWAHWSAQCVPEQGDWYARAMYIQGHRMYDYHVKTYGHPSRFGFMEIDNLWRAEHWDPDRLMQLYVDAGAKFFVALANHEDNFDCYDSKYFAWNSVNVGPHRDIVGTWAKVARAHGLRFGVSNHSSHAWHWFQTAYGYDAEGPMAGVRYDAYRLAKADGRGKWWEGLDPQDLYCGPCLVMPDGIKTAKEAHAWNDAHNLPWTEAPPPNNPVFVNRWFYRFKDLVESYDPDFVYLDNTEMPLGQAGFDAVAEYYNANIARHGGKFDGVLTDKGLKGDHKKAVTEDFERNRPAGIHDEPFSTDTCIGDWHYRRDIEYKTVGHVVRILVDTVSKNGTLLLNIPLRGDGTPDDREIAFLHRLAAWMKVNGKGIFGTRPWTVFGEGPTPVPRGRAGDKPIPYTPQDLRFTTKDGKLYLFVMAIPTGPLTVKSLGLSAATGRPVREIALLGSDEKVTWTQGPDGLTIEKPARAPAEDVISYEVAFD